MITEIATVKIAQGKTPQALEWLAKIAAYIKKARPSLQVSQLSPVSGSLDAEIVLTVSCPTLSDWDALEADRRGKPEWQTLVKECREASWFVGLTRQFYRVVE
jgi:hypothetical protein